MAIKVDGTNNKLIFYAGTGNSTTVTSAATATPWTATLPPTAGIAGQVLTTDGTGNLSWGVGGGGAINVVNDTTTNAARYPLYTNATSGTLTAVYVASPEYQFNPGTGVLTAPRMQSSEGMHLNANTITASYTLPPGYNALSAGPITVNAGVVVTAPAGQAWAVV